jgi:hypothetical protein
MDTNETNAELTLLSADIMKLHDRLNALVAKGTLTNRDVDYVCLKAKAELTCASRGLANAALWNLE